MSINQNYTFSDNIKQIAPYVYGFQGSNPASSQWIAANGYIQKYDETDKTYSNDNETTCSITLHRLNEITHPQDFVGHYQLPESNADRPKSILMLPCGHIFDAQAIKTWYDTKKICPNCRQDIPNWTMSEKNATHSYNLIYFIVACSLVLVGAIIAISYLIGWMTIWDGLYFLWLTFLDSGLPNNCWRRSSYWPERWRIQP